MNRYEARLTFGMASLLPLLLLPGYMLLGWVIWSGRGQTPALHDITAAFELMLALAGGLSAAHLMSIEREEGFDELRRSYAEKSWRVPVARALTAGGFIALSALIAAVLLRLAYGDYRFEDIVLPIFPPALYLCALAMLVNNVSGSYWLAAGVVGAYWFGEFLSGGEFTGIFYLFNHTYPRPEFDAGMNRAALLALALALFAMNAGFSMWRRRRG